MTARDLLLALLLLAVPALGLRHGAGARPDWGPPTPADTPALDVNRASLAELIGLDGVGPALARRIASGRPYSDVAQLIRVSGIGPRRLAALRAYLKVE